MQIKMVFGKSFRNNDMNYEKEKVCGWHDAHIGLCTSVIKMLRKRKLIEGRNPHLYVSKRIFMKNLRSVRMKIPLVLIRSKYQRKSPLARELFFSRFARTNGRRAKRKSNRTNLFKSFKSFSYLYDLYRFVRFLPVRALLF